MDRLAVMRTFVRVVDTGSFSAAARDLNISQPAVSKAIVELEERLGVLLLMRSTQRLMLTEAGEHFCEGIRRALEEVDEAEIAARGAGTGLSGRLRVSSGVTLASLYLVPRLPTFLAAHPNISIDLVLDDCSIDLIKEGIDIGLRIGPLRDVSQTVRKVATRPRHVLGTPAYFERAGTPKTPEELSKHEAVIFNQDCGINDTWIFHQGVSQVSVRLSARLRVNASEAMRSAVLGGMGLAIASEWIFAPELTQGTVRAVLGEWSLPASYLWLLFPAGRTANAKARAFADFVEAEVLRRHIRPEHRFPRLVPA